MIGRELPAREIDSGGDVELEVAILMEKGVVAVRDRRKRAGAGRAGVAHSGIASASVHRAHDFGARFQDLPMGGVGVVRDREGASIARAGEAVEGPARIAGAVALAADVVRNAAQAPETGQARERVSRRGTWRLRQVEDEHLSEGNRRSGGRRESLEPDMAREVIGIERVSERHRAHIARDLRGQERTFGAHLDPVGEIGFDVEGASGQDRRRAARLAFDQRPGAARIDLQIVEAGDIPHAKIEARRAVARRKRHGRRERVIAPNAAGIDAGIPAQIQLIPDDDLVVSPDELPGGRCCEIIRKERRGLGVRLVRDEQSRCRASDDPLEHWIPPPR